MTEQFVIFGLDVADYVTHAYGDLIGRTDVTVVWGSRNVIAQRLKKITTSYRLNRFVHVPFQWAWCKLEMSPYHLNPDARHIFLCFESPEGLNPDYLRYLKTKFRRSAFCLVMLNPLNSNVSNRLSRVEDLYDCIVTCNEADANRQGWLYHADCYSKAHARPEGSQQSDVCFIGADKGRAATAFAVYRRLTDAGLTCDFLVVGNSRKLPEQEGFSYSNTMLPYDKYLARMQGAKCLLEIVSDDSQYCTLRTMEAVTYKKKLLTTNRMITREPFFSSQNIQVFEDAGDIDTSFVAGPYQAMEVGDPFSANHLLEFVSDSLLRSGNPEIFG